MRNWSIARRAWNTFFNSRLGERIFFLHMPKCGGTSLDNALKYCYLDLRPSSSAGVVRYDSLAAAKAGVLVDSLDYASGAAREPQVLAFSERFTAYHMHRERTRYISGHISFNEKIHAAFSDRFRYVTVLRDPVQHLLSAYFYVKHRSSDHGRITAELDDFIDSPHARSFGSMFVQFLCGQGSSAGVDFCSADMVERAKRNLEKFDLVGVLEDMDGFMRAFHARFGRRLWVRQKNRSPAPQSRRNSRLSDADMEKLRALCAPNMAIYAHARKIIADGYNVPLGGGRLVEQNGAAAAPRR